MSYYAKPESALKRANELEAVGQAGAALVVLHDCIRSRRNRVWQPILEKIMMKHTVLCVDLRKGRVAKEGLIQYRITCQHANQMASLEDIIRHFLSLADERAKKAKEQAATTVSEAAELAGVVDLDEEQTPESLMLGLVNGETATDRADREVATPWLKFLWETYRTSLEVLRNQARMFSLYNATALAAFQFCLRYKRNTEFRRLCEILRIHLNNLNRFKDSARDDQLNLSIPENMQASLDVRFEQLKVATDLELWQESFRSVEDLYNLLATSKVKPKLSSMATYFHRLTLIFRFSDKALFHAFAWYKVYSVVKAQMDRDGEEDAELLKYLASQCLISVISVPPIEVNPVAALGLQGMRHREEPLDASTRIGLFVGVGSTPLKGMEEQGFEWTDKNVTQVSLLAKLKSTGIVARAHSHVRRMALALESTSQPREMISSVVPLLESMSELQSSKPAGGIYDWISLTTYGDRIKSVLVLRVLKTLSNMYTSVKISNVQKLFAFASDFNAVERQINEALKEQFVHGTIDYLAGCVRFGSSRLDTVTLTGQLQNLAMKLDASLTVGGAQRPDAGALAAAVDRAKKLMGEEHQRLLDRKALIARRKEEQDRAMLEKEKKEEMWKLQQLRATEEAEAKRLVEESTRREKERIRLEIEERERQEAETMLAERLKQKGKKATIHLEGADKATIMKEAIGEQIKERQEAEKRMLRTAKQLDHLERASREEEKPLLEAWYEAQKKEDEVYFKNQVKEFLARHRREFDRDVATRSRVMEMAPELHSYTAQVEAERKEVFARLKREREEETARMKEELRAERQERRLAAALKSLETARKQLLEDKLNSERNKELEAKQREERERREKQDAIAAKQREREAEIERRQAERMGAVRDADGASARPPSTGAFQPRRGGMGEAPPPPQPVAAGAATGAADGRPAAPPVDDRFKRSTGGYRPPVRRDERPPPPREGTSRW